MADLKGTLVAAPVLPFADTDTFPTHYAMYGKGNIHSVVTIADRNNISTLRREIGMFCYIQQLDEIHQLVGGIDNTNWISYSDKILNDVNSNQTHNHTQIVPSLLWSITHNLNKFPSVTISDSAGSLVFGEVKYTSLNTLTITFSSEFSGTAYLT